MAHAAALARAATVVFTPAPRPRQPLPAATRISVLQANPKRGKSAERYERYKVPAGDGRQGGVA